MLYVWVGFVFLIGASVGSFLNVCVARLPFEKSILWPGSRCGRCFQPIRARDNLPLLGYWLLRGRCRSCGQTFAVSYFFVELFTACAFAGLFYLEVIRDVLDLPFIEQHKHDIEWGLIPWQCWAVFGFHAALLGFLITVSLCDFQYMEVPLSVTVCGTIVGLIGATLFAWPFPAGVGPILPPRGRMALLAPTPPVPGLYPWPVWPPEQLPSWLPPGSWHLGLATGLAGTLAGMVTLRGVRFLFGLGRGKEGLGIGDADVMMMAGSFLGWQPTLVSFFIGVFAALFVGVAQLLRKGDQALAFAPALSVGVMTTLLTWPMISRNPSFVYLFSEAWILGALVVIGAVFLLLASFLLRLIRGAEKVEVAETKQEAEAQEKNV